MNSKSRQDLVDFIRSDHAHVSIDRALDGLDPALRNKPPVKGMHSIWDNFEHMRLAQEDMLMAPGGERVAVHGRLYAFCW